MEISKKEWNAYIESMKNAISEDKASPASDLEGGNHK